MTVLLLAGMLIVAILLLRRMFGGTATSKSLDKDPVPRAENVPAFMTASMQAVIQNLREQEKELERLHKEAHERADNTARMSESHSKYAFRFAGHWLQTGDFRQQPGSRTGPGNKNPGVLRQNRARRIQRGRPDSTRFAPTARFSAASRSSMSRRTEAIGNWASLFLRFAGTGKPPAPSACSATSRNLPPCKSRCGCAKSRRAWRISAGIAHEFRTPWHHLRLRSVDSVRTQRRADTPENACKILEQTRSITRG